VLNLDVPPSPASVRRAQILAALGPAAKRYTRPGERIAAELAMHFEQGRDHPAR
jgi:hypothetical protein